MAVFSKTINALKTLGGLSVESNLQSMLETGGISVENLGVLRGARFLYAPLPGLLLEPVLAFSPLLSYENYKQNGAPRIHFCPCPALENDIIKSQNASDFADVDAFVARQISTNSFCFSVVNGAKKLAEYRDMELKICSECENLLAIFGANPFEYTLLNLLDDSNLKAEATALQSQLPFKILSLKTENGKLRVVATKIP